jgi:hypothetical protein
MKNALEYMNGLVGALFPQDLVDNHGIHSSAANRTVNGRIGYEALLTRTTEDRGIGQR